MDAVIGDILNPPFKPLFDVVFTLGVLQHVSKLFEGFRQLHVRLRAGGLFCHSLYSYETNGLLPELLTPVQERVLRRLPLATQSDFVRVGHSQLRLGGYRLRAVLLHRTLRGWASRKFFYFDFIMLCFRRVFKGGVAQIFDQLNASLAAYFRKSDVEDWMRDRRLALLYIL